VYSSHKPRRLPLVCLCSPRVTYRRQTSE